jgi:hypothetical protein
VVPVDNTPINESGVFYLRILLQALFTHGFSTLLDVNARRYLIPDVLYSRNNALLNSFVYWDSDAKRIYVTTSQNTPANLSPYDRSVVNDWVQSGVAGPQVQTPAPIYRQVAPYLYDVVSPV